MMSQQRTKRRAGAVVADWPAPFIPRPPAPTGCSVRDAVLQTRHALEAASARQAARAIAGTAGMASASRTFSTITTATGERGIGREQAETVQYVVAVWDELHHAQQLSDREHAAAIRLSHMARDAGVQIKATARYGETHGGGGEMSDDMAEAHAAFNRVLRDIGSFKSGLMMGMLVNNYAGPIQWRATFKAALDQLGRRWGLSCSSDVEG